jgi:hypothetical protein
LTSFTQWNARVVTVVVTLLLFAAHPQQFSDAASRAATAPAAGSEVFHFGAEWRLIRAGQAKLTFSPGTNGAQAHLKLESTGMVSKLYKIDDDYRVGLNRELCAQEIFLQANEGRRRRETTVTFDAAAKKASYLERDLVKNNVASQKEIEIPGCVHDVIGGLMHLRKLKIEVGQAANLNISDGKKSVTARVESQEREEISTPLGKYKTIRYEVFLFNDVLYKRKGRLFVWITDDERRLPVQIRARLQFHVGTITFQLEKEEHL